MGKRQISITLDSELLGVIDKISKSTNISRSELIEFFIRKSLKQYEDYSKELSIQKRKQYDIADRIIEETIIKAFGDQE